MFITSTPRRKTDSDGKQVVVGVEEDARLFCRTNAPWKKCLWKPPRNGVRQVGERERTSVDVMITIVCDFEQFPTKKIGVFLKSQCYNQNFA
jgi:hypothetical protein